MNTEQKTATDEEKRKEPYGTPTEEQNAEEKKEAEAQEKACGKKAEVPSEEEAESEAMPRVILFSEGGCENGTEIRLPCEGEAKDEADSQAAAQSPSGFFKLISYILSMVFCFVSVSFLSTYAIDFIEKGTKDNLANIAVMAVYGTGALSEPKPQAEADNTPSDEDTAEPESDSDEEITEEPRYYPIVRRSLSLDGSVLELSNQTSYEPDTEALAEIGNTNPTPEEIYSRYGKDKPCVLILHTHATESFSEGDTYDPNDGCRTSDTSLNVVTLGEIMTKVLEKSGINTVHFTDLFDEESYKDSYSKSYSAAADFLEENPSCAYVFDIHRDSVIADDYTKTAPCFEIGGKSTAQAMIVTGTDEGGANHPDWAKNLAFALSVQSCADGIFNGGMRKINLRNAAFNQGLSRGSLLLEIGSCGNTLTEAKRCAVYVALSLAEAISGEKSSLDAESLIDELCG